MSRSVIVEVTLTTGRTFSRRADHAAHELPQASIVVSPTGPIRRHPELPSWPWPHRRYLSAAIPIHLYGSGGASPYHQNTTRLVTTSRNSSLRKVALPG